jgi:Na+/H+-dicarboxylate symporter
MNRRFAVFIVGAMALGVTSGWLCHQYLSTSQLTLAVGGFDLITTVFLRLIKMIIAPLVLTTLIVGIGHMEDAAAVGRIGAKTIGWFLSASLVSLTLGLVVVQWLRPGAGVTLRVLGKPPATPAAESFTLSGFVAHVVPTSLFDALARNEILQIVVFAVFVGTAVSMLEERAPRVMQLAEEAAAIMLKVTEIVMRMAPAAIFASLASTVATQGLPILVTYAKFVGGFYGSMLLLWGLLFAAAFLFIGPRASQLFAAAREPVLIAFSTASSEAAYPRLLAALPEVGVPRRIVAFVLPLGYSFNLDGSMMYCTFATLFILQAHGIALDPARQVAMLFLLMITSKGIAGVPRASLVIIMATLSFLGLPEAWIALVLGVDQLLDMGRSGTNIVGNAVAAAVVSRWEGVLGEAEAAPARAL